MNRIIPCQINQISEASKAQMIIIFVLKVRRTQMMIKAIIWNAIDLFYEVIRYFV